MAVKFLHQRHKSKIGICTAQECFVRLGEIQGDQHGAGIGGVYLLFITRIADKGQIRFPGVFDFS